MAEYSWTLKETGDTLGTGYLNITNPATITVSGTSFTPTMPTVKLKLNDKYAASNDSFKYTFGDLRLYCGSTSLKSGLEIYNSSYVKNNVYVASAWRGMSSISTSSVFTASNKTSKTVAMTVKLVVADYPCFTSYSKLMTNTDYYDPITSAKDLATLNVTLNAPPTTSYTQVKSNTSGTFYANVTTATVTLSSLTAYYGGDFSNGGGATLTIGSQTASRTSNGDLSIRLNATGTFTPTLSLKDSRGQTRSYTLNAITVTAGESTTFDYTPLASSTSPYYYAGKTTVSTDISNVVVPYSGTFTARLIVGQQVAESLTEGTLSIPLSYVGSFTPRVEVTDSFGRTYGADLSPIAVEEYSAPSCHLEVQRTRPSEGYPTPIGAPDDEGESATIIAEFTYTDEIATLQEPTVSVVDSDGTSVSYTLTWYSSRDATTGALSGSVTWANVSSGGTVYGLVSSASTPYPLDAQHSYQITLTPRDNYGSGESSSQTVSTAFYTVDFLAGGHGIAFGLPATKEDVFECGLDAEFNEGLSVPESKNIHLGEGRIYQENWNDTDNLYYVVNGYHAFYSRDDGTGGKFYIRENDVQAIVPFTAPSYNGYTLNIGTNNTTDTWVLVMNGYNIQHRVIPSNANGSATKYSSVWTDGSISLYRRGNTVHAIGDPNLAKTTARTRFGTIPDGFRPVATAYAPINGSTDYLLFYSDGQILCNARAAGRIWFSCTWATG